MLELLVFNTLLLPVVVVVFVVVLVVVVQVHRMHMVLTPVTLLLHFHLIRLFSLFQRKLKHRHRPFRPLPPTHMLP